MSNLDDKLIFESHKTYRWAHDITEIISTYKEHWWVDQKALYEKLGPGPYTKMKLTWEYGIRHYGILTNNKVVYPNKLNKVLILVYTDKEEVIDKIISTNCDEIANMSMEELDMLQI